MFKNLSEKPIADHQSEQAQAWEDMDLLKRSLETREGRERFLFYEGPPTANGKPGIHHVISRTLKDSVCKHKAMEGYQVPRKAGWDTHGLPVEIEVEKQLGLFTKKDIEDYGIREFNEKCRESVFRYESMWREMSKRMGFLADMDDPYITLNNDYIQTGWWILKEFFDSGLIYEGHKILPYCPRCGTGLASHEVSLGYKEVKTNTITTMFKRTDDDSYFLAWTTTPWTCPSNVALTVGPNIDYIKARLFTQEEVEKKEETESKGETPDQRVKDHGGKKFYLAKSLADKILGAGNYEIIEEMKGQTLEFLEYEQLMPFIKVDKKAFYITVNDYATDDEGTGIVHTAPAFGEDDYNTGRKYGLPVPNPVDEEGKFMDTPWKGRFVLEDGLDVEIIKWLAAEGKLFSKEKMEHNYPFCWRCDTPLIYYSKPSWYIEMTKLKDDLVEYNNAVNWFPDYIGEKRFGNWLENVNDWAISRSRYWGTPIPIWRCSQCGELKCMESRQELKDQAKEDIDIDIELHRPFVDEVHLTCDKCGGEMSRIPEVMDCWFDSGSMPFAQMFYPFQNKEDFDEKWFPADFICEGIDQTRGWFYSLIAISTFIRKSAPYKNVLVNDLILDKNGKKMSKSKGNTADPFELFDKYGADATRWYLLYVSPAWSPTRFDEDGLIEVAGKYFGTLRNIYNFFVLYANQDKLDPREFEDTLKFEDKPELDRWILSKYNSLIKDVIGDMDVYDHMKAVRKLQNFVVEDFSNWYIRRARRRFWASELTDDKKSVYRTTYEILVGIAKLMAPLAPFIPDEIYINLTGGESVHLELYPEANESFIDRDLDKKMDLVRVLVGLGRGVREKEKIKVRQPLSSVLIDGEYEDMISDMTDLIKEELNIKQVLFQKDLERFMDYKLKPDFKVAGPELGGKIKSFAGALSKLDSEGASKLISELNETGEAVILLDGENQAIKKEWIDVQITAKEGFAVAMEDDIFTILDTTLTDELIKEGLAREFVSKVQQIRKQMNLEMMDNIRIRYSSDNDAEVAIGEYKDYIKTETLALEMIMENGEWDKFNLNGHDTGIHVEKV